MVLCGLENVEVTACGNVYRYIDEQHLGPSWKPCAVCVLCCARLTNVCNTIGRLVKVKHVFRGERDLESWVKVTALWRRKITSGGDRQCGE